MSQWQEEGKTSWTGVLKRMQRCSRWAVTQDNRGDHPQINTGGSFPRPCSSAGGGSGCSTASDSSGCSLNKGWEGAGFQSLSTPLFVLLLWAQRARSLPFSSLVLKKVNYDPGASATSWHVRFSHCRRRMLSVVWCKN